ncbi:spore coat protein [Bacillus swezeyi]|uniref:Spore coat protein n=1 Tax=Bacillus swezeyi TaxID=1925020 RepID=A0A1R1RNB6_9BACI|nr:spore coat protein [Bacillus swezeyi]MEC1261499.1 spore coat protein [Bacillus swezeyi]MED1739177.1 spore coat protein [Bacillus swezeyi]MED2926638.1 spore coat protein [Bacillus swezeyi]MED2944109.1 spore coat protein [Bacillus swezeyi]MED2965800.1 spore coat protein [Bacillus swezeyi]
MSFHENAEALYEKTFNELSREFDQLIEVIDSEHVTVNTANITAALSLQAIVITLIIMSAQLAIDDQDTADIVSEHVLAVHRLQNRKRTIIQVIGSRNVTITLSSLEIVASVQILTEVLIVLLTELDIL